MNHPNILPYQGLNYEVGEITEGDRDVIVTGGLFHEE